MLMSADEIRLWSRGRYVVTREIGPGRVGDEYVANDNERRAEVLLTVIPVSEPDLRKRFEIEFRHLHKLNHPSIQPLFEHGAGSSFVFHTGPYLPGETLRQRLEREGTLSVKEAFRIARDTALALSHAHKAHIMHRDLVPDSIFITRGNGRVIVMGFGAPQLILGFTSKESPNAATANPLYLAPEHISGTVFDARADVYCLGTILFEMLIGAPPTAGASGAIEIFNKILIEQAPAPSSIRPDLPRAVDSIVLKALAKNRTDRYADAADFATRLKKAP